VTLLRLGGKSFQGDEDGPVTLGASGASYGMNRMVQPHKPRAGQLTLVEYESTAIDVDGAGGSDDDFDELFAPRHLRRANVLFADGSVSQMYRHEIEPFEEPTDDLWKHQPD
jgi:prepilin-type processing-associated H-X9-DG protein